MSGIGDKIRSNLDGLGDVGRGILDACDQALGFDDGRPKPITLTGVNDAHFVRMDAKVAALESSLRPLDGAGKKELERGGCVSSSKTTPDGKARAQVQGLVDMPLERFFERLPAEMWGRHLYGLVGGEVKELGNGKQVERMVLRMPGADLDMTKVESVHKDSRGTTVRWEVLKSDNGTVVSDIGLVRFERHGNKTLVTFLVEQQFDKFPALMQVTPKPLRDKATETMVVRTFEQHIAQYRKDVARPK